VTVIAYRFQYGDPLVPCPLCEARDDCVVCEGLGKVSVTNKAAQEIWAANHERETKNGSENRVL
jgi:hypothetical protein